MEHELTLNLWHPTVQNKATLSRYQVCTLSWQEYQHCMVKGCNIKPDEVQRAMYTPHFTYGLILYLSNLHAKLSYKEVWGWYYSGHNIVERLLRIWRWAGYLPTQKRARVRSKITRLFRTSGLLPTDMVTISVPSLSKSVLRTVRSEACSVVRRTARSTSRAVADFIMSRIKFVPTSPGDIAQQLADQIQMARMFRPSIVEQMPEQANTFDCQRKDAYKLRYHVHYPAADDLQHIKRSVEAQLWQWAVRTGQTHIGSANGINLRLQQHQLLGSDETEKVVNFVRAQANEQILVPLDRDTRRRCTMDAAGYRYRLQQGYFNDPGFYTHRTDLLPEQAAEYRRQLVKEKLPRHLHNRVPITPENMPRAYHNYKGKCIENGQLVCNRDHCHEREVVSSYGDPIIDALRPCARALRLARQRAGMHGWTLYDQSSIHDTSVSKCRKLRYHSDYIQTCPCGHKKEHKLSMLKVDASQIFKAASAERAIEKTRCFLKALQTRKNVHCVAVAGAKKP